MKLTMESQTASEAAAAATTATNPGEKTNPQDAQKGKGNTEETRLDNKEKTTQLMLEPAKPASTSISASIPASASTSASAFPAPAVEKQEGPRSSSIFDSKDFTKFLQNEDIAKVAWVTKGGLLVSADFEGAKPSSISSKTMAKSADFLKESELFNSLDKIKSMEFFKSTESIDPPSLGSEKNGTTASNTAKGKESAAKRYMSKEWKIDYQNNHVDVNYTNFFRTTSDELAKQAAKGLPSKEANSGAIGGATPPPPAPLPMKATSESAAEPNSKPPGTKKTDWNAVYANELMLSPALIQAAQQATPVNSTSDKKDSSSKTKGLSSAEKRRRGRKLNPEVKAYVLNYTDDDVLGGRGGRSNHHPGNKRYRDLVTETQDRYRSCGKHEKTLVAQSIVDEIQEANGRFLELDKKENRWYIVPNLFARRKVGQALRENNTEEARKAKRVKYNMGKNSQD